MRRRLSRNGIVACCLAAILLAPLASAAHAAQAASRFKPNDGCTNTGPEFTAWLATYRRTAATQGISQRTISAALDGLTLDQGVLRRDRGQSFFSQTFLSFSSKLISDLRIQNGRKRLAENQATFARAEKEFGVPPAVIAALWGLESDYGAFLGKLPVLRSLATLAWDCRRTEMFTQELTAALKIVDRGDLRPDEMIGPWAGELGQTQFLPTHYVNFAVDWDGDGRRDLIKSVPDAIGSTAAFLNHLGWRRGEPWLQEVRVPKELDWQEADLTIRHPRTWWAQQGVRQIDGSPLPGDTQQAALILPQSRHGPAFLAYPNFDVFVSWNQSLNYATTAAYLATRLAGAPMMRQGTAHLLPVLDVEQTRDLQRLLAQQGLEVGEIDGKVGAMTRAAVRQMQMRLKMPADSYPTPELLERLRRDG